MSKKKTIACPSCHAGIEVDPVSPVLLRGHWSGSCCYDLHQNCKSATCDCPCHPHYDQSRAIVRAQARAEFVALRNHRSRCRNSGGRSTVSVYGRVHGMDGDSVAADIMQYMESDIAEHGVDGDDFDGIGFGGGEY